MPCRCAERGRELVAATKAAIRGDTRSASAHLAKAAETVRADTRELRSSIASGRASLSRR